MANYQPMDDLVDMASVIRSSARKVGSPGQGGATNEYFHLSAALYDLLTDVNAQLEALHTEVQS